MTFCFFTAQYLPTPGGVERYTWNLARRCVADGHRALIVTSALPGLPVHCFALPEKPLPAAAFEEQMALAGLTPEGLYKQITALWEEG